MDSIFNFFKGTIEKRILAQVKKFIRSAEKEYEEFVRDHDASIDRQIDQLELQREQGKRTKESELVDSMLKKFM